MSDFYNFVVNLRAIRDYKEEPLSDEHLDAILEAARWTGSSKNLQNWSFVVVQDEEQLSRVADCALYSDPLRASAATIVIVNEPGGYEFDSGRVAQNMMLAAAALGVASCPITLHQDRDVADLLGLGADQSCRYAVAFGYPTATAAPKNKGGRKPIGELVHWERI